MNKIKLSVIVISYNMKRELPRTLISLSTLMQLDICSDEYEVIIIDNGTKDNEKLKYCTKIQKNYFLYLVSNPEKSPVNAINFGLEKARGDLICVMIDGARMASPRMLATAIEASKIFETPVIGVHGFHIGPEVQMKSVLKGYNQEIEDRLLLNIDWQKNGYRLFDISVFAGSSRKGWFVLPSESNAIFLKRKHWENLNGYDTAFKSPGGGLANLDIWKRSCATENAEVILLFGEGTFHQIHGGIATNAKESVLPQFFDEYFKIRNENYIEPKNKPVIYGTTNQHLEKSIRYSLNLSCVDNYKTKNVSINNYKATKLQDVTQIHYLHVLFSIHKNFNPISYLEIGVRNVDSLALAQNFGLGIDPNPTIKVSLEKNIKIYQTTSDDFFNQIKSNEIEIDFAFIDGMHLFEFALRDFINIEKYSNKKTIVAIDDIYPTKKEQADRLRHTQIWTGDIWKLFYCLKKYRKDLKLIPINTSPTGLLLVYGLNPNDKTLINNYEQITNSFIKIKKIPSQILNRKKSITFEHIGCDIFFQNLSKKIYNKNIA